LGKPSAVDLGAGTAESADFSAIGPSAFQRELDRARRHLARLEAEQQARSRIPALPEDSVRFDESPTFVRTCNLLIWAIVVAPVLVAAIVLLRRLAG
jgi:hypothetical protein